MLLVATSRTVPVFARMASLTSWKNGPVIISSARRSSEIVYGMSVTCSSGKKLAIPPTVVWVSSSVPSWTCSNHLAEVAELGGRKDVDPDPPLRPSFEEVLEEDAGDVVVGVVADRPDVTVLEDVVLGVRGARRRAERGRGGEGGETSTCGIS